MTTARRNALRVLGLRPDEQIRRDTLQQFLIESRKHSPLDRPCERRTPPVRSEQVPRRQCATFVIARCWEKTARSTSNRPSPPPFAPSWEVWRGKQPAIKSRRRIPRRAFRESPRPRYDCLTMPASRGL